jgi:hypothetical protein
METLLIEFRGLLNHIIISTDYTALNGMIIMHN